MGFVGEVFNFRDFDPEASSDVEVLMETWDSDGLNIFPLFDGFWACIIHDLMEDVVHVVTDPLGKKPLYIHAASCSISSEIKALIEVAGIDARIEFDELYFSSVQKWGYHVGDETPIKGILKIRPSTHLVIRDGRIVYGEKYVAVKPRKVDLRNAIEVSVSNRMVSDVPVACLLSGGLDSSIVFKLMLRHRQDFTVIHVDNGEEEFLNYLDIPSSVTVIKVPKIDDAVSIETLKQIVLANESPSDLGSMIPQYRMSKALKKNGIHVVMTGDGADELFGGYRRSQEYDSQWSDVFQELVYYHLPRLDKLSMAHTVELRSPFLSLPVVEAALALPYGSRIDKNGLKSVFTDIIPAPILARPKLPLKSPQVKNLGLEWVRHLCNVYKEAINESYRNG
jgi:asparagine synthase (glutamine-hydrolysing)